MLAELSATQTSGDMYACVTWTLARCPRVVVLKDTPTSAIEFNIDDQSIEVIARKYYRLCDAKVLSNNFENQILWG